MKKTCTGNVYLTGSRKSITRMIYTDDERYYIKWYGGMIEVMNVYGVANITSGWKTVDAY